MTASVSTGRDRRLTPGVGKLGLDLLAEFGPRTAQ